MHPFHLAFPVSDLQATRQFYIDVLGCSVGRESERWIDFDFYGHQITAHLSAEATQAPTNSVDGHPVPIRHFGAVLPWAVWHSVAERLRQRSIQFRLEPHIRFEGRAGEQATMFFDDPSGNAIELKSFRDPAQLFARN